MTDKILTACAWLTMIAGALMLLPLTLIAAWFLYKAKETAQESTEHYTEGYTPDDK